MIKHIVFFRFTESLNREERKSRAEELREIFSPLDILPSVYEYRVGINIINSDNAWDIAIDSSFESLELLEEYRVSPEHQEAISRAGKYAKEKSVVDYEYQQ